MLSTGEIYNDLGGDYFQRRDPDKTTRRSSPSWSASATRSPCKRPKPRKANDTNAALSQPIFLLVDEHDGRYTVVEPVDPIGGRHSAPSRARALAWLRTCTPRRSDPAVGARG